MAVLRRQLQIVVIIIIISACRDIHLVLVGWVTIELQLQSNTKVTEYRGAGIMRKGGSMKQPYST